MVHLPTLHELERAFRSSFESPRVRRGVYLTVAAVLLAVLGLLASAYVIPLPDRLLAGDSTVVAWRDGTPAHVFLSEDDRWRIDTPLEEIDDDYVDALIRFEDKRFHDHIGIDPVAIARAATLNIFHGRRLSGASTITMQLVRLLEPRPRTYRSKLVEAFRAVQLEMHMSKEEILANYLRFAPYGRNIEGIEAASIAYFGHRADNLSADEIATLLAVPQMPNGRSPAPANEDDLRRARDEIATWIFDEGGLDKGLDADGLSDAEFLAQIHATPVPRSLRPFPREVPHAAYWLRSRAPERERIVTTFDEGTQRIVESTLARHEVEASRAKIRHAAVVLMEHSTGEIRGLAGNFRFDTSPGAQLPSFALPRSTGSLLKPVIFAMAIERGVAHPEQLVVDTPMRAGSYTPSNFDGTFRGLVRLEDALSDSLNVPFVHLLATLKVRPFLQHLTLLGAESLNHEPGWYGLSAAVGGVEMTPLEVAGIYGALANDGAWNPPHLEKGHRDIESGAMKAFEPGASWLTRETLRRRDRPDFPRRREISDGLGIHWKTGTSYGHLDAWSAGSGRDFTAIVWMGNHDRTASSGLTGGDRAAPLLFDLLEAVEEEPVDEPRPDDLVEIEVCSYSGHLPTPACTHRKTAWALEKSVPVERCPYHVEVDVDVASGRSLAPNCRAGREYERRTYKVWPASVRRHLADRYRYGAQVPSPADGCDRLAVSHPPHIVSPPSDQEIVLIPGMPADEQELKLEAETSRAGQTISWFVDGEFLGSGAAHQPVWWIPTTGTHEVVAMDESGRASSRTLRVSGR